MPIIRVEMWEGRTLDQKRELVEVLSKETARIAGCSIDSVYVVIEDVRKENWGASGQLTPNSGYRIDSVAAPTQARG